MPAMTSELLEELYDGARPVRTLVHLFAGQRWRIAVAALAFALKPVSYTHLTLPTIYSV